MNKTIKDIIFFEYYTESIGVGWQEWRFDIVMLRKYTIGFTFTKELR